MPPTITCKTAKTRFKTLIFWPMAVLGSVEMLIRQNVRRTQLLNRVDPF